MSFCSMSFRPRPPSGKSRAQSGGMGHDAAGFLHAALTDGHFHNASSWTWNTMANLPLRGLAWHGPAGRGRLPAYSSRRSCPPKVSCSSIFPARSGQIADAPAAEAVRYKARREVAQVASAGQADQHMSFLPVHHYLAHADAIVFLNHLRGGIAQRVPELHDVRIRCAPGIHQRLHFLLGHFRAPWL